MKKIAKKYILMPAIIIMFLFQTTVSYGTSQSCATPEIIQYFDTVHSIQNQLEFIIQSAYSSTVQNKGVEEEIKTLRLLPSRISKLSQDVESFANRKNLQVCQKEQINLIKVMVVFLQDLYEDVTSYLNTKNSIDQYTKLENFIKTNSILNQIIVDYEALTKD